MLEIGASNLEGLLLKFQYSSSRMCAKRAFYVRSNSLLNQQLLGHVEVGQGHVFLVDINHNVRQSSFKFRLGVGGKNYSKKARESVVRGMYLQM